MSITDFRLLRRWNNAKNELKKAREKGLPVDIDLVKEEANLRHAIKMSKKRRLTPAEKKKFLKKYLYQECEECHKDCDRNKMVNYQGKDYCLKCFKKLTKE